MIVLVVAAVVAVVVWLAGVGNKILVALLVQEVRGALADRLKRDIQDAVRPLPVELRETYQAEWLGELDAATDRPLKAVFMVQGFKKAARGILASDPALAAVEPGPALPRRRVLSPTAEQFATILRRLIGLDVRFVMMSTATVLCVMVTMAALTGHPPNTFVWGGVLIVALIQMLLARRH
jgi:hypothetical protein